MAKHIMVDIETVDTATTASIVSIGAVSFDKDGQYKQFYQTVDWWGAIGKYGRTKADSTMKWWSEQSEEARKALQGPGEDLRVAMAGFSNFVQSEGAAHVWGFGSTFDNVILRSSFVAVDIRCPWSFRGDMCFRTLREVVPTLGLLDHVTRQGTHHNALDDAMYQARQASVLLNNLESFKNAR